MPSAAAHIREPLTTRPIPPGVVLHLILAKRSRSDPAWFLKDSPLAIRSDLNTGVGTGQCLQSSSYSQASHQSGKSDDNLPLATIFLELKSWDFYLVSDSTTRTWKTHRLRFLQLSTSLFILFHFLSCGLLENSLVQTR